MGSSLVLAIAYELVRAHDGKIELMENAVSSTIFSVSIIDPAGLLRRRQIQTVLSSLTKKFATGGLQFANPAAMSDICYCYVTGAVMLAP